MGKITKNKSKKTKRHSPLDVQIEETRYAKNSTRVKLRNRRPDVDEFVDDKLSKKILFQARQQQEDLEEEVGLISLCKKLETPSLLRNVHEIGGNESEDEDVASVVGSGFMPEININPDDEKALENFMCKDPVKRATLADIIKEKLTEKQTEIHTIYSDAGSMRPEDLERVTPIYRGVAKVMSLYSSGKMPKAFKVIPKFNDWEQILFLTDPDKWTAAAMFQATRIFSSNLKDKMAQRFYHLVLLPRLRDDIEECKVLNFHLYQALRKALFKPAAFFKGIILPLCESRTCTLREATIFGSVLAKCSVPVLHSSAALLRIAELPYSGASSILMRVLLEKKYALPFRVTNGVVDHFVRFVDDKRELPLLWHQCLLTFVQLYSGDLSTAQKQSLFHLTTVQHHEHIAPEVRKCIQITPAVCQNDT